MEGLLAGLSPCSFQRIHSGVGGGELPTISNVIRARNNGRSTDNVRTDWGVDRSTFRLAGHVDQSQSIVLKTIVISMWRVAVHCETLI